MCVHRILLFMSKIGNGNNNKKRTKKEVSTKLVFNKKKKKNAICMLQKIMLVK